MSRLSLRTFTLLQTATSVGLSALAWAVTGVRPIWSGSQPSERQRIYFANHTSHGDFILLSACLSEKERAITHAIAAAEYWGKSRLRRFIAEDMLSSVLISRQWTSPEENPISVMLSVLDQGHSLIIFPEGTRNMSDELLPFRSGLYNLSMARPDVELIPCWIENMSRVLPKGQFLPVPLLCRVVFGAPVSVAPGEERRAFLERARAELLALNPRPERDD
ncbi:MULTISPECIES: lysophospholipid acyltransferase family protein [unclassified Mesorhizobium]|uniref:lysophospholipid acyltransferase family protein n=1 Tax=unclassified Mesorhizobium TaxID=325217 RepID=UPI000BAF3EBC|nr:MULTISPECIES: lysophospholipid acyltransferase family protein [unclassified Mesorhizobium]TGT56743.1 1-acyl-sn-glycerol-3-phosphate acyltransferase [Mesorhizobium sp. M00.F.Ca.ET.170.01.1.1]AZO08511.1 1-acyl-sn-glycerol-3-phosphate acyltransferase [Mesorhizobium sp. M3A.F.Ca.ET.080.04.2.1]PBB85387.1 1-acyl-sn-glycerol-3-phosphate acyltransferase [Mesorhizobium sp. WSM3876]RWB71628.1 MAG: 1-acyl-sn-glycerol-3-phosphate acyltransferase [Mesorhizobium sp.]RWB85119.1 MAG: 1-acyl-sn-glycerol-3-p